MGYHCDFCEQLVHRDKNAIWATEDGTSECLKSPVSVGHLVDGRAH